MLKKALLKAIELNNITCHSKIKIHKISCEQKIFHYYFDEHKDYYNNRGHVSKVFDNTYRINSLLKDYLQLKEKIISDDFCIIFLILRKLLGKDIAQFICCLIKSHIQIRISDNLNKFNELCEIYKKRYKINDNLIDVLFKLCEFTCTMDFT